MGSLEIELIKIVDSIEINCHPEKIMLFGSLAAGRATKGSDIDLEIVCLYNYLPNVVFHDETVQRNQRLLRRVNLNDDGLSVFQHYLADHPDSGQDGLKYPGKLTEFASAVPVLDHPLLP